MVAGIKYAGGSAHMHGGCSRDARSSILSSNWIRCSSRICTAALAPTVPSQGVVLVLAVVRRLGIAIALMMASKGAGRRHGQRLAAEVRTLLLSSQYEKKRKQ